MQTTYLQMAPHSSKELKSLLTNEIMVRLGSNYDHNNVQLTIFFVSISLCFID